MPPVLTPDQYRKVAAVYQVDPRILMAIAEVEAPDGGFLPDGRLRILLERHILWHRLKDQRGIDPLPLHRDCPDLCDLQATPAGGYGSFAGQWERVGRVLSWASAHDGERFESYKKATYEACSWGRFQLLGENYKAAGYADVYTLKHQFEAGEQIQLEAALRFMVHDGMLQLVRDRDFTGLARRYNGPGKVADYAGKLRDAFNNARI